MKDTTDRRRTATAVMVLLGLAGLTGPLLLLTADRGQAAFGDAEVFGRNEASAATVSIEVGDTTLPIDTTLLAPGDSIRGRIVVENQGTLPLRYAVLANRSAATARSLLDVLQWTLWAAGTNACDGAVGAVLFEGTMTSDRVIGDARIGEDPGDRALQPGTDETLCVEVTLPLGVDDSYQAAEALVTLSFVAEQATEDES